MNCKLLYISSAFMFSQMFCSNSEKTASAKIKEEKPSAYVLEKQNAKFVMGLAIKTNNQEAHLTIPKLWERFFQEKIIEKIPNKINSNILCIYTDYEGDFTKPYLCIIGCEVSSIENTSGLVAKTIPQSNYAIFTSKGEYPQSLIETWKTIWQSKLERAYESDFEVYKADFNPKLKPEVRVYVSI